MKKYSYKNIILFQTYGRWYSDYEDNGRRFALDYSSCGTKATAYELAKKVVDYLNNQAKNF